MCASTVLQGHKSVLHKVTQSYTIQQNIYIVHVYMYVCTYMKSRLFQSAQHVTCPAGVWHLKTLEWPNIGARRLKRHMTNSTGRRKSWTMWPTPIPSTLACPILARSCAFSLVYTNRELLQLPVAVALVHIHNQLVVSACICQSCWRSAWQHSKLYNAQVMYAEQSAQITLYDLCVQAASTQPTVQLTCNQSPGLSWAHECIRMCFDMQYHSIPWNV